MKESAFYQMILEEGESIGARTGALAEARKILLRQGRVRFGMPETRVTAALGRITNVERLEELGERLLQAASWEELLGLPKSRRRPKA